ncbi:ANK_REP_REGION domain-containing protein [Psidium guajava]|nr:ANK_REP_REGION domain-containing protein [Psidium guajava]
MVGEHRLAAVPPPAGQVGAARVSAMNRDASGGVRVLHLGLPCVGLLHRDVRARYLLIYMLNLLIGFLSPQVDPELQELVDGGDPSLPTRGSDEFRPFVCRLPEFNCW